MLSHEYNIIYLEKINFQLNLDFHLFSFEDNDNHFDILILYDNILLILHLINYYNFDLLFYLLD